MTCFAGVVASGSTLPFPSNLRHLAAQQAVRLRQLIFAKMFCRCTHPSVGEGVFERLAACDPVGVAAVHDWSRCSLLSSLTYSAEGESSSTSSLS